ncbi:hypothetical protein [Limnoraphis robusta]|nr:hypothetical protein [Limnoraphis robusta]
MAGVSYRFDLDPRPVLRRPSAIRVSLKRIFAEDVRPENPTA